MEFTDYEQGKQYAFDSFCRKVLRNEANNFHAESKRQREREVLFSELSEREMKQLFVMETYPCEQTRFNVLDYDISIASDLLAEAIASLPKQKRDILLLYHVLGMSDQEIANMLHMVRRTVQHQRKCSMLQVKMYMEIKADEYAKL